MSAFGLAQTSCRIKVKTYRIEDKDKGKSRNAKDRNLSRDKASLSRDEASLASSSNINKQKLAENH